MNGLKYKSSGISDFTAITIWQHKTLFFENISIYDTSQKLAIYCRESWVFT